MRLRSPGVLLALVLLALPCVASAQAAACQTETRRIEWKSGAALAPEVCISPNLSTTVLFERAIEVGSVMLEGRERFQRVEVAGNLLVLVGSEKLKPGERLSLKVRLEGTQSPGGVQLLLVVHRAEAERLVEVSFGQAAADSCSGQLREAQAQLQSCLEQGAQPSAQGGASLLGLLSTGLMDEGGITTLRMDTSMFTQAPENTLEVKQVLLYRSTKRLAIRVKITNPSTSRPWSLEGAALLLRPGQFQEALALSEHPMVAPGATRMVWLEWELLPENAQRLFALKLWDAEQARPVILQGLRLP